MWWAACPPALWDPAARPAGPKGSTPGRLRLCKLTLLDEALATEYIWDACALAYIVVAPNGRPVAATPRLNKEGLSEVQARGYRVLCGTRWADIDEPGSYDRLTDERWALYQAVLSAPDAPPTIHYRTHHGVRLVQLLSRPLTPAEYEVSLSRWLAELRLLFAAVPGAYVDQSCKDWTRLMRLPRVVREKDGSPLNLWHTEVHRTGDPVVDPGDCTPPVKLVVQVMQPVSIHKDSDGDTRYGLSALRRVCQSLGHAQLGQNHSQIYKEGCGMGSLVAGGELQELTARHALCEAIAQCPEHERALWDGFERGLLEPRSAPRRPEFDAAAWRAKLAQAVERIETDDDGGFSL